MRSKNKTVKNSSKNTNPALSKVSVWTISAVTKLTIIDIRDWMNDAFTVK